MPLAPDRGFPVKGTPGGHRDPWDTDYAAEARELLRELDRKREEALRAYREGPSEED